MYPYLGTQMLHVYKKENGQEFKVDTAPAHSGWEYQFTFLSRQTSIGPDDVIYYVYPATGCGNKTVSRISYHNCLPLESFYVSQTAQEGYSKVLLLHPGEKFLQEVTLENYGLCCKKSIEDFFYASVTVQGDNKLRYKSKDELVKVTL